MKTIQIIFFVLFISGVSKGQNEIVEVSNAKWSVRLNEPYIYDYQKSQTIFKIYIGKKTNDISIKLLQFEDLKNIDTLKSFILPKNKISFDYGVSKIGIIKYTVFKDSVESIIKTKTFRLDVDRNDWVVDISLIELENISYAIKVLKMENFWAFYNSEKSDFPEIDSIKAQFKDSEGILDIDKLGAYLKTKPAALAKYCDFE